MEFRCPVCTSIADIRAIGRQVRFVPIPDSCTATKFVLFATSLPRLSIGCAITGLIATAVSDHAGSLPTFGRTQIPGWRSRAKLCSIGAIDSHPAADRHMLSHHERRFLLTQRVGHLATADSRAIPHVVPVCFTISQGTLYI